MTQAKADGGRTAHTPGPWIVSGEVREVAAGRGKKHSLYCADIVLGEDDPKGWRGYIASVQSADHIGNGITREEAEANAAFIVRACNSHDALVKALEAAEEWLSGWASAEPYLTIIRATISSSRSDQQ